VDIWQLLVEFIFRLTFGVALAMSLTPARLVTSGFFRVHLWVLLGLNTFAALAIVSQPGLFAERAVDPRLLLGLAIGLAVGSYVGSVIWLYERSRAGTAVLALIAVAGLTAAIVATPWGPPATATVVALRLLDLASSGVLLGVTLAAMFLGHWYLNTPTMQLAPLRRLVLSMQAAILARAAVCGIGLVALFLSAELPGTSFWAFVAFRWLAGLVGPLVLGWMTWVTLKIPNTQSATGILYAAVILTFIGELTSQLLARDAAFPL